MTGRPRRRITREAVRRDILIYVEGRKTEELYLVDWARRYRREVLVTFDEFRGGPLQLTKRAVERKKQEASEFRKGRGRPHDSIWCVFDVDDHPNIGQSIDLAIDHSINLAISNPCLELWFLLHFEDQTAFLRRDQAQRRAEAHLGCSKVLTNAALQALSDRYDDAARRAMELDAKHAGDGSPPGANPSSGLRSLIREIRGEAN